MSLLTDILRACNGEVVNLPYNEEQREVTQKLVEDGLVCRAYDDDQPTAYLTAKGEIALSRLAQCNTNIEG